METAIKRICAIFPGALGDFLCFLPALRTLLGLGSVDLYARREFACLLPDSITVRSLNSSEVTALFQARSDHCDKVLERWKQYDAVYSWHGSGHPEVMHRLRNLTRDHAHFFRFRPLRFSGHQSDYYLACLPSQPAVAYEQEKLIAIREDARRWAEQFWLEHALNDRPILALGPGSGAREKNWSAEFFLEAAQWWRGVTEGEILVLIGPVERERGELGQLPGACLDPGQLSLGHVTALLERSLVYLGNDSGISHLAGAVGVRTVVLFGPTEPRQWAPRGRNVLVLRKGLACSPCNDELIKTCPHHACLLDLRPREVIAALAALPEVVTLTR